MWSWQCWYIICGGGGILLVAVVVTAFVMVADVIVVGVLFKCAMCGEGADEVGVSCNARGGGGDCDGGGVAGVGGRQEKKHYNQV